MIRKAMRQNPFHPEWYWLQLGSAFLAGRRYEDAIEAYKRRTRPMVWVLSRLAICYAHLGRDAEAREITRQILMQNPNFRISNLRGGGWSVARLNSNPSDKTCLTTPPRRLIRDRPLEFCRLSIHRRAAANSNLRSK
jgi:tetratricopeptide (TPR) repeat protein